MTDIKLSKRMNAIVDMVDEETVADIGCDHSFVSIALVQRDIASHVVAMDVRSGPVKIAIANVHEHKMDSCIDVRISDGFESLGEHEAECAIIAGMGGSLMVGILERGKAHLKNKISLVLQPQSDIYLVREYLHNVGYEIVRENMLVDEDKYYTIMRAVPALATVSPYTKEELEYGRILLAEKNPVLMEYLSYKYDKNEHIMMELKKKNTEKALDRINELILEQQTIRSCLGQL